MSALPPKADVERPRITGLMFDVKPTSATRMFVSLERNPLEAGDTDSDVCKSKSLKPLDRGFSAGVANLFKRLVLKRGGISCCSLSHLFPFNSNDSHPLPATPRDMDATWRIGSLLPSVANFARREHRQRDGASS
jgi:hypothetical protein